MLKFFCDTSVARLAKLPKILFIASFSSVHFKKILFFLLSKIFLFKKVDIVMQDIYEKIREALRQEWQNGATQQEIADRANVTNPYINNLLSGKRKVESMKLETLFKLFPQAEINLSGAQLAGDHVVRIQGGVSMDTRNLMNKILSTDELSDAEKVKVLKVLQK